MAGAGKFYTLMAYGIWVVVLQAGNVRLGTEVLRPRGVPLNRAPMYDASKVFACFDGSNQIPFSYVNDDYCDCHDASDEPGTAACSQGFFHCVNRGFRSFDIPSSRVSDGICDCCDGSDEYDEKVSCGNTCMELGRQMREEAEQQMEILRQGYQKRLEYVESVKNKKTEKTTAFENLENQLKDLQNQNDQLTKAKHQAEEPEKAAIDAHKDQWEAAKAARAELRDKLAAENAFKILSVDQNTVFPEHLLTKLTKEGEELNAELADFIKAQSPVNLIEFATTVWPKIKDTFVALHSAPAPTEPEPTTTEPAHDEDGNPDHEHDPDEEVDDSASYSEHVEDEDKIPEYDAETKLLIEAADKVRHNLKDLEAQVSHLTEEKNKLKRWLDNDYGPDLAFAVLDGECFEFTDREYTYRMCPFDKVTQRNKDGGGDTALGKWGNWENGYKVMKFTDGARCWNGPSRSTNVKLECGAENQLGSASEPSRCEYEMVFKTPVACTAPPQNHSAHGVHEEL